MEKWEWKQDAIAYRFASLLITAVVVVCIILLTNSSTLKNVKEWFQSTLTIIVSGVVGYRFGKSNSSK